MLIHVGLLVARLRRGDGLLGQLGLGLGLGDWEDFAHGAEADGVGFAGRAVVDDVVDGFAAFEAVAVPGGDVGAGVLLGE